jgi:hypothetical protein
MRKNLIPLFISVLTGISLPIAELTAGNEDRAGQAGAYELLINPWARSSGWSGANSAIASGLEASFSNIAGTAFTKKTELLYSNTQWLVGSGLTINAFGLTQKAGEAGVIGLSVMSMGFGDIQVTTVDNPQGGIGNFSPKYFNIGASYAKAFSNSIYGGINVKVISESISNVKSQGVAFDAGIQYVTTIGSRENKRNIDNLRFGMSLKNVGPPMRYSGDGLSFRTVVPSTGVSMTVEQRSAKFELPSLINIGLAYIYRLDDDTMHQLTPALTYTSNSFGKDQFNFGVEYAFKSMFMLRGGYTYEKKIGDAELKTTALSGFAAGFTFDLALGKKGTKVSLDYSYRTSNPFNGCHSIGARITL